jgi:hypothetical protein
MSQATILASVVMANIGLILSAYVSIKVTIGKIEVKVDNLKEDIDALGGKIREIEKQKKEN